MCMRGVVGVQKKIKQKKKQKKRAPARDVNLTESKIETKLNK